MKLLLDENLSRRVIPKPCAVMLSAFPLAKKEWAHWPTEWEQARKNRRGLGPASRVRRHPKKSGNICPPT